jgi:hypothetical protein
MITVDNGGEELLMAEQLQVDKHPVATDRTSRAQVLYDGECPLCRKSVALLKRLDWL